MNIAEKVKEQKNTSCIDIREKKSDFYTYFLEFELDNGEYILVNMYLYQGRKINDISETFYEDEGWASYKESVIDKIYDDTFWDNAEDYMTSDCIELVDSLREGKKEYIEVYNKYIDVIEEYLKIEDAISD